MSFPTEETKLTNMSKKTFLFKEKQMIEQEPTKTMPKTISLFE